MKTNLIFILIFLIITALTAGQGYAVVFGSSNLGPFGYPEHSCTQPTIPYDRSEFSLSMFENEFSRYQSCIKDYLEGAEKDRERILERHNEAVEEFNRFIRSVK